MIRFCDAASLWPVGLTAASQLVRNGYRQEKGDLFLPGVPVAGGEFGLGKMESNFERSEVQSSLLLSPNLSLACAREASMGSRWMIGDKLGMTLGAADMIVARPY